MFTDDSYMKHYFKVFFYFVVKPSFFNTQTTDVEKKNISKCWALVSEDGGSLDTLHYKLGVSVFKCEDYAQTTITLSNSISLTQPNPSFLF